MTLGAQQHTKRIPVEHSYEELSAEAYSDFAAPLFSAKPLGELTLPAFSKGHYWAVDQGLFILETTGPVLAERAKSHISESAHLVAIDRVASGRASGLLERSMLNAIPGPIAVDNFDHTYKVVTSEITMETVYTPKSHIGFDEDRHGISVSIDRYSATGQLAHISMDKVFRALQNHRGCVPAESVEGFFACMKIALGVHPQREDVRVHARAALQELIYRHIEDNLGDPELTPDSLLEAFGISRASLFRMFEPLGGVRNYIMQRRAIRAVLDISTSPPERGVLREISEKWGFSTQPNFNRTIQRMFGASPGRLFGEDTDQSALFRPHSDFFTWSQQAVERVVGQVA